MRGLALLACLVCWLCSAPALAGLDAQRVNEAQLQPDSTAAPKAVAPPPELLVKAQILLSRAHFSPGEIEGKPGSNFSKALAAFTGDRGLQANDRLTNEVWQALASISTDPA